MLDAELARRGCFPGFCACKVLFYFYFLFFIFLICLFVSLEPPSSPEALKLDLAWRLVGTLSASAEGYGAGFPGPDAEDECQPGAL